MTIKELAVKHDYYCSDSNYFSRESQAKYLSWPEFLADMGHTDEDLNLCFRWDVHEDDNGFFYMEAFFMHQRKGRFFPIHIARVIDEDADSIVEFMTRHWNKLQRLWAPLSVPDMESIPNPVSA